MIRRIFFVFLILFVFLAWNISAKEQAEGSKTLNVVSINQSATAPKIDGDLGKEEWSGATKLEGYFTDRFTGKKLEDLSEIYLMQHGNILYVAFIYHEEDPSKIVARMTKDQSNITTDDSFGLVVDMFHNHSDIGWFCLNPLGTKMWQIFGGTATKTEWAGGFVGAAKITEYGWQGEMGIDLGEVPHGKDIETVGIGFNIDRRQQHRDHMADFFPVGKVGHSIHDIDKEKMGDLVGLKVEETGLAINTMPYFFFGEKYDYTEEKWEVTHREGVDIKVPFLNSMTGILSVMSDVENIENEVEGIDFEYSERYVADRRPFWQEGSGYRETYGAFHSGRVARTHIGASVFGKPTSNTSTGAFLSYNKDEGAVSILSGGTSFGSKTGGGLVFVNQSGLETSLIHAGMGTQAGKDGWFSTGGNITVMHNGKEEVVGERYLQHITLALRNYVLKTVPYYTSEDYINPIGFERFIGVYGSRTYTWITFKHKEQGIWGKIVQESSYGLRNDTGNFTDGLVYRRTFGTNANFTTRSDLYLDVSLSGGKYSEYDDGTLKFDFKGRKSDPKTNYGCLLETGWRQEEPMTYLAPYGSISFKGLTGALQFARLWHVGNMNLVKLTFAYDVTPGIGLYGRAINRDSLINTYFGFRKSGYIGTDIHFIIGGANRTEEQTTWVQKRVLLKIAKPFNFKV